MSVRRVALVSASSEPPKVKQYIGLPTELTEGRDERTLLPGTRVVLLLKQSKGFYLYRYSSEGVFAGDTWHQSLEDAEHQAAFEFGANLGPWQHVPAESVDPHEYAIQFVTSETS